MSAYRQQAEVKPVRPLTEEEMQEDPEVAQKRLSEQGETARVRVTAISLLIGMMTLITAVAVGTMWSDHCKARVAEAAARHAEADAQKAKDEAVKAMFDSMRTQDQLKDDWIKGGCSGKFYEPQTWKSAP